MLAGKQPPDLRMTLPQRLIATSLLLTLAAVPGWAASSAASSASDSVATSIGSISTSIQKSSDSSSKATGVAEGDYRITDVAAADGRPGEVRVQLQAVADPTPQGALALYLPQAVADGSALAPGGIVAARHRPYGLEFAQGEPRTAFFLAVTDDWFQELQTRPVVL